MNRNGSTASTASPHRWPLILIALPAAVAIWSGWVGLGGMCGFGLVQPFPGIVSWHLDTAITLPVGVEAYGAFALGVWIRPGGVPETARRFARRSASGALGVGMAGQVIFHLLAAAHRHRAPWPVVVLVSCLPVIVLGFGAGLTHLLRADETVPGESPQASPEAAEPQAGKLPSPVPGSAEAAAEASMRATAEAGNPWKVGTLQSQFGLSRKTAAEIHGKVLAELISEAAAGASQGHALAAANGSAPGA